jgi:hypothetical protein
MVIAEIPQVESTQLLLDSHIDEHFLLDVIAFLFRHPDSRYVLEAISAALDCSKLQLENTIRYLVCMGVVELYKSGTIPLYALTKNTNMRKKLVNSVPPYIFDKGIKEF